ncbi:MAG TPA: amino acid ABC transporter substrate-binding protein [Aggregatilineales bacterium]|nr:amino acid ABC transporter substrate-binding protein [Aggregatilineales bacterium]
MKLRVLTLLLVVIVVAVPFFSALAQDEASEGCPPGAVPDDAPVVKFGAAVADTGSLAREGADTRNGYTLWLEWVNQEHGGINVDGVCHRAELIMYDDESDNDTVSVLIEKLIFEDEVDVILGPYGSGLTQIASAITERENIIMVEGNGASETLFERGFQNLFGVLTPATGYTRSGIELAASLGAKTGVIAYEDAAFAASVAEGARQWMEENGIEVLAMESYPVGVTDLTAMFTQFRDLDADLFVGGGHFNDAVLFLSTARVVDFNPDAFLITVGPSNPTFVEEVAEDSYYVWGATQWESTMSWEDEWFGTAKDYADRFEARFGMAPSYQAAESTAAALVLHVAIEAAGSLETDAIRAALNDMDIMTFYGPINFDETGKNTAKPMATVQIQDGVINVIAPEEVAVSDVIWPAPVWNER